MKKNKKRIAFSAMMMTVMMVFSSMTVWAAPQMAPGDRLVTISTIENPAFIPFNTGINLTLPFNSGSRFMGAVSVEPGYTLTIAAQFGAPGGVMSHKIVFPDGTTTGWRFEFVSFVRNSLVIWTGDGSGGNVRETWRVYFMNNSLHDLLLSSWAVVASR